MKKEILTFYIGGYLIGIDILKTKEMVRNASYDKVASSPPYILGLLNLRGQIITLFDLKKIMLVEKKKADEKRRCDCIVLKRTNEIDELIGFEIDEPGEVIEVEESKISPSPANIDIKIRSFVEGIIKNKDKTIILISVKDIFMNDDLKLGGM